LSERVVDVAAPQRFAGGVAEDQVVVGQRMAGRQHPLRLAGAVAAQHVDRRVGQVD
jgi:hypothetical protein